MKILERGQGPQTDAEYLTFTHRRCGVCDEVKPVTDFYRTTTRTARGWAWDTQCIECSRAACRTYGTDNKDRRNARLRTWRAANPDVARSIDRRKKHRQKYGITVEQREAMELEQKGRCAICGAEPDGLVLDHDHATGKIRALLCRHCNVLLGWYEARVDLVDKFHEYLERFAIANP